MFDPTIFDNLKVVFEGAMYDMDMSGTLHIVNRTDRIELSTMSRSFGMEAVLRPSGTVKGSFTLQATLADLAAELLSEAGKQPGCGLELAFEFGIEEEERDCAAAEQALRSIWGKPPASAKRSLGATASSRRVSKADCSCSLPASLMSGKSTTSPA
ncbi:hypothetical protein ACHHV8_19005 [Paenibacillus sp. TAB 01]|uniref:hypothetical protein n=1 Tax=Paenibacillus sp. TAB 01 TaxID=3368988 RepID=UPI00375358BC